MTFEELRALTEDLLRLGNWLEVAGPVSSALLVNQALDEWSADAEYATGEITITSVAQQSEYSLTTPPDWVLIRDAYWGTDTNLCITSEDEMRRRDPMYRQAPASTPGYIWIVRPNVVRLFPKPTGAGTTVTLYGVRCDAPLVNSTDSPTCPRRFHRYIAYLAAFLHADRYATGDDRATIDGWYQQSKKQAKELRLELGEQNMPVLQRHIRRRYPDIVTLGGRQNGTW